MGDRLLLGRVEAREQGVDLPQDFVTRIVGADLVRVRSQTTYYVLSRIKAICKVYLDRQRAKQIA